MEQNWPRYWNGKRWVSGTAAALHYIKEHTEEGHFRGLLDEAGERAIRSYKKEVRTMFEEAAKPNLKQIK